MSHHEIYHYNLPGGGGQDTANAYNYRLADSGGAGSLEEAHHELFKISPEVTAGSFASTKCGRCCLTTCAQCIWHLL